jgi:SAM-dependent methyltransferase
MTDARDRPSERPEPGQQGGAIWWHSQVRYLFARQLARGKRVLDIACANGFGTVVLAEVASEVAGADLSKEAVETARRLTARPNVRYELVTKPPFPFADGSFDLVVCLETIEHMHRHEQPAFVGELARLLSPEGVLVLSTPDKATERAHDLATKEPNPWHLHTPDGAELDALLASFPHRLELLELDFVATTIVPRDPKERSAKLSEPAVALGDADEATAAPVSVIRVCARTPEGLEQARRARSPVAYRADFQRLALLAQAFTSWTLPDVSGYPVTDQLVVLADRLRKVTDRLESVEKGNGLLFENIDQLNRNLSLKGLLDRLRGKRSP